MAENQEKQWSNGFHAKKFKPVDENFNFYPKSFWFKVEYRILVVLSAIWFFFVSIFSGYRVKNKKVLRQNKKNVMVVCNHSFMTDTIHLLMVMQPKMTYFTMLESNLGFGIASFYFRHGGGVPIPHNIKAFKVFYQKTIEELKAGRRILFFPEGNIHSFANEVSEFKNGAFKMAYKAGSVIIPCCHTFHTTKGLRRLFRKHQPTITLTFLEPYHIDTTLEESEAIEKAKEDVRNMILEHQHKNSDWVNAPYKHKK